MSISSENNTDNDKLIPIESSYIPDGYSETERILYDFEQTIIYSNDIGNEIMYNQKLLKQTQILIDSENAGSENLIINGIDVNVLDKNGYTKIYWHDKNCFLL